MLLIALYEHRYYSQRMRNLLDRKREFDAAALKLIWNQKKKELGLTQEKAAHLMGWHSQAAVAQYLNGKIPLNTDAKMKFAELLNVSPASIWPAFVGPSAPIGVGGKALTKFHVPVLSWTNAWRINSIDTFAKCIVSEWVICPADHSANAYALRVVGDTMTAQHESLHSYPEGSIIFVDPKLPAKNSARVIVKLADSDEVTFRQLTTDMGKMYLKPINNQYAIREMPTNAQICGVVIGCFIAE